MTLVIAANTEPGKVRIELKHGRSCALDCTQDGARAPTPLGNLLAFLEKNMTVAHSLGIGVVVGIALFFVLQRLGVLDKWLEKLDR